MLFIPTTWRRSNVHRYGRIMTCWVATNKIWFWKQLPEKVERACTTTPKCGGFHPSPIIQNLHTSGRVTTGMGNHIYMMKYSPVRMVYKTQHRIKTVNALEWQVNGAASCTHHGVHGNGLASAATDTFLSGQLQPSLWHAARPTHAVANNRAICYFHIKIRTLLLQESYYLCPLSVTAHTPTPGYQCRSAFGQVQFIAISKDEVTILTHCSRQKKTMDYQLRNRHCQYVLLQCNLNVVSIHLSIGVFLHCNVVVLNCCIICHCTVMFTYVCCVSFNKVSISVQNIFTWLVIATAISESMKGYISRENYSTIVINQEKICMKKCL